METPSSTRSQVIADSNKTIKESEKKQVTKKSGLTDITNGSPIVGLATGILETPSSVVSRSAQRKKCSTPGSGEALLRGQVKNLLQMIEEEAEISLEKRLNFFHVQGIVNSPVSLIAPTPANTPLMDLSGNELLPPVTASPVEDKFIISQILNKIMYERKKQDSLESETSSSNITRSLLLDFSDKSESSVCSSVFKYQEEEEECDDKYEEIDEDGGVVLDELYETVSSINVNGGGQRNVQKIAGKLTKFVYNSDDEFEGV